MENILFSLFFIPVLYLSGTLSLAPFTGLLPRKKLAVIYSAYALFLAIAVGIFYSAAVSGRATFALVKHALLFYALAAVLVHICVLPRYFREWIFSAALATQFHYLIGAVATFLIYRYYGWDSLAAYTRMELLSCILIAAFYVPIRRLLVKTIRPFLSYGDIPYWHSVFLVPVAMLLACYFMLPGNAHMERPTQVLGRLFMVLTAFFVCHSVSADFTFFQEKQAIEEQLRQQKLYYSSMQLSLEKAREQRHDLKHHLAAIQHFIETDNKDGLREYCGELAAQDKMLQPLPYSGNSAADGVLYHYMTQSMRQNIRFTFQGTVRSSGIADTDLCVILGNALDNALAGCMTVAQDRFIDVTICSESQLLSILVQNSFDGLVQQRGEKLLSRKRKNREGVGISSMNAICSRYGGMIDRSWDEHTFTVCVHLPMPEKEG